MRTRPPIRDPIRAYQRDAIAARRLREGARCACGESRTWALIPGTDPVICTCCDREKRGIAKLDDHHVAGDANSPVTTPVPVNDHLAELNRAQYDWPRETLQNPDGSPLLAAAASIRGYSDTNSYLVLTLLVSNPEMLEALEAWLREEHGQKWWIGTPVEKYAPKR